MNRIRIKEIIKLLLIAYPNSVLSKPKEKKEDQRVFREVNLLFNNIVYSGDAQL